MGLRVIEEDYAPIASRSGLLGDFQLAPLAIAAGPAFTAAASASSRSLATRVTTAETSSPDVVSYQGSNSTDPTGVGDRVVQGRLPDGKYGLRVISATGIRRVQIGEQDDGKYGLRVYDNTGALVHDYTTAA